MPIIKSKPGQALTSRERQVVQGLADGLSYKLVADRIGITANTVKFHLTNTYIKLGITTGPGAVAKALREGVII